MNDPTSRWAHRCCQRSQLCWQHGPGWFLAERPTDGTHAHPEYHLDGYVLRTGSFTRQRAGWAGWLGSQAQGLRRRFHHDGQKQSHSPQPRNLSWTQPNAVLCGGQCKPDQRPSSARGPSAGHPNSSQVNVHTCIRHVGQSENIPLRRERLCLR